MSFVYKYVQVPTNNTDGWKPSSITTFSKGKSPIAEQKLEDKQFPEEKDRIQNLGKRD
jgi:hypothetical protein